MKDKLLIFINQLLAGDCICLIPKRKGLRKMIDSHIFHDYAEIFLQISGKTKFSFPSEELELHGGQILVVPPELPHGEIADSSEGPFENIVITPYLELLQCHISRESKQGIPTIFYYETVDSKQKQEIRQYTDLLIAEGNQDDFYGKTISRALLLALLTNVVRMLSTSSARTVENTKVNEVKNTVLAQYHSSQLSVSKLADQLNCTADYLSWLFHRETGETLNRYINGIRLKRATDLLKNTDYAISEIAWICGFKSPAYFSRTFSKKFLSSPKKFREKN